MSSTVPVLIHRSQFPAILEREWVCSFQSRSINHKFHYETPKQAQKWIALHAAYSPAIQDPGCRKMYRQALAAAAKRLVADDVHVVSLGCGSGEKDVWLQRALHREIPGRAVHYTPCDASASLVVTAHQCWHQNKVPGPSQPGIVCDVGTATDLRPILSRLAPAFAQRIVLFFGMIPNFEPQAILPRLKNLVGRADWLIFSANLAPGSNYERGVRRVLPGYDNRLTRDWLFTALADVGIESADGRIEFGIESKDGLLRIVAVFHFRRRRTVCVAGQTIEFARGEVMRLFFSYRYTVDAIQRLLSGHGFIVQDARIASAGEEGVFLCRREKSQAGALSPATIKF